MTEQKIKKSSSIAKKIKKNILSTCIKSSKVKDCIKHDKHDLDNIDNGTLSFDTSKYLKKKNSTANTINTLNSAHSNIRTKLPHTVGVDNSESYLRRKTQTSIKTGETLVKKMDKGKEKAESFKQPEINGAESDDDVPLSQCVSKNKPSIAPSNKYETGASTTINTFKPKPNPKLNPIRQESADSKVSFYTANSGVINSAPSIKKEDIIQGEINEDLKINNVKKPIISMPTPVGSKMDEIRNSITIPAKMEPTKSDMAFHVDEKYANQFIPMPLPTDSSITEEFSAMDLSSSEYIIEEIVTEEIINGKKRITTQTITRKAPPKVKYPLEKKAIKMPVAVGSKAEKIKIPSKMTPTTIESSTDIEGFVDMPMALPKPVNVKTDTYTSNSNIPNLVETELDSPLSKIVNEDEKRPSAMSMPSIPVVGELKQNIDKENHITGNVIVSSPKMNEEKFPQQSVEPGFNFTGTGNQSNLNSTEPKFNVNLVFENNGPVLMPKPANNPNNHFNQVLEDLAAPTIPNLASNDAEVMETAAQKGYLEIPQPLPPSAFEDSDNDDNRSDISHGSRKKIVSSPKILTLDEELNLRKQLEEKAKLEHEEAIKNEKPLGKIPMPKTPSTYYKNNNVSDNEEILLKDQNPVILSKDIKSEDHKDREVAIDSDDSDNEEKLFEIKQQYEQKKLELEKKIASMNDTVLLSPELEEDIKKDIEKDIEAKIRDYINDDIKENLGKNIKEDSKENITENIKEDLTENINNVEEDVEDVEEDNEDSEEDSEDSEEEVEESEEEVEDSEEEVEKSEEDIEESEEEVEESEEEVEDSEEEVEESEEEVEDSEEDVEDSEENIEESEEDVEESEEDVEDIEKDVEEIEEIEKDVEEDVKEDIKENIKDIKEEFKEVIENKENIDITKENKENKDKKKRNELKDQITYSIKKNQQKVSNTMSNVIKKVKSFEHNKDNKSKSKKNEVITESKVEKQVNPTTETKNENVQQTFDTNESHMGSTKKTNGTKSIKNFFGFGKKDKKDKKDTKDKMNKRKEEDIQELPEEDDINVETVIKKNSSKGSRSTFSSLRRFVTNPKRRTSSKSQTSLKSKESSIVENTIVSEIPPKTEVINEVKTHNTPVETNTSESIIESTVKPLAMPIKKPAILKPTGDMNHIIADIKAQAEGPAKFEIPIEALEQVEKETLVNREVKDKNKDKVMDKSKKTTIHRTSSKAKTSSSSSISSSSSVSSTSSVSSVSSASSASYSSSCSSCSSCSSSCSSSSASSSSSSNSDDNEVLGNIVNKKSSNTNMNGNISTLSKTSITTSNNENLTRNYTNGNVENDDFVSIMMVQRMLSTSVDRATSPVPEVTSPVLNPYSYVDVEAEKRKSYTKPKAVVTAVNPLSKEDSVDSPRSTIIYKFEDKPKFERPNLYKNEYSSRSLGSLPVIKEDEENINLSKKNTNDYASKHRMTELNLDNSVIIDDKEKMEADAENNRKSTLLDSDLLQMFEDIHNLSLDDITTRYSKPSMIQCDVGPSFLDEVMGSLSMNNH